MTKTIRKRLTARHTDRAAAGEKQDTKKLIVEIATELIQQRGYQGFSYQDIATRLGIKKASIHYHFPKKEDLGIAVISAYYQYIQDWIGKYDLDKMTARENLEKYFQFFTETHLHHELGCVMNGFLAESESLPDVLREKLAWFEKWHLELVTMKVKEGVEKGEFKKRGAPEEQALFIIAATMGALNMAHDKKSPGYYETVTRQVIESLIC
ncbi:MAG: TetR/AcrR family transcriptional regulator [Nitrospinae bacterium]|nr:TetR/AcrR family transcriptional regulator [Nitrospinota bacterium]